MDSDFEKRLKDLLAEHTHPQGRDFQFAVREGTEDLTYEAVYAGDKLPLIDFQNLAPHLASKPKIATRELKGEGSASTYPTGAIFDGYFEGAKVVLILRCSEPPK